MWNVIMDIEAMPKYEVKLGVQICLYIIKTTLLNLYLYYDTIYLIRRNPRLNSILIFIRYCLLPKHGSVHLSRQSPQTRDPGYGRT